MVRSSKKLMVIGVLVVAALLVTASRSEACWGWGCYQPVSYYTPYYASWCAPCYASCCYTSCYTPYCGGCWGGCDTGCYSCGYWGCCDPCCTTTVSSCCGSVSVEGTVAPAEQQPTLAPSESETPGTQVMPAMPSGTENAVPGDTSTYLPTRHTSGLLTVWVPANAKVFINGKETTTEGTRRRYVSYGLNKGLTYKYEIRAEVVRNGMLAEEQKTVYLTAGANEGVAFGFNRQPSNQVAAQQ